jgi:hypothetical protein
MAQPLPEYELTFHDWDSVSITTVNGAVPTVEADHAPIQDFVDDLEGIARKIRDEVPAGVLTP